MKHKGSLQTQEGRGGRQPPLPTERQFHFLPQVFISFRLLGFLSCSLECATSSTEKEEDSVSWVYKNYSCSTHSSCHCIWRNFRVMWFHSSTRPARNEEPLFPKSSQPDKVMVPNPKIFACLLWGLHVQIHFGRQCALEPEDGHSPPRMGPGTWWIFFPAALCSTWSWNLDSMEISLPRKRYSEGQNRPADFISHYKLTNLRFKVLYSKKNCRILIAKVAKEAYARNINYYHQASSFVGLSSEFLYDGQALSDCRKLGDCVTGVQVCGFQTQSTVSEVQSPLMHILYSKNTNRILFTKVFIPICQWVPSKTSGKYTRPRYRNVSSHLICY